MFLVNVAAKDFTIPFNNFLVEPLTVSCFSVEKGIINFRVDVVSCPKIEQVRVKRILPVHPDEETTFTCKCGCPLTEAVRFRRVLPLPSHGLQVEDMFCHYHETSSISVAPRVGDCLYDIHYISINKTLLKNVLINSLVRCNRCRNCIGSAKKEIVHLWNACMNLPHQNISPVEEFKNIIKSAIQDSFDIFLKIFLECLENSNGLLISVMDRQLIVSRACEDLKLRTCKVVKLKYEYFRSDNEKLKRLLQKENVTCVAVPKTVLNEGLKFLLKSSEEIPPLLRFLDGELMAYLDICD